MSESPAAEVPEIIESLARDHEQAKELLNRYEAVGGRKDWFCHVRESLVRHEVAEEIAVYPAIRHLGDPSVAIIEARIDEQSQAEKMLSSMEHMELTSDEFAEAFTALRAAVLNHAENEERTIFPAIVEHKSIEQRRMMGQRYQHAKASAPTHPHPHAPDTPPGNVVLGPIAALADRIRDSMQNDDARSESSSPAAKG